MNEKKSAAAMSAVMAYIKEEEEIACEMARQPVAGARTPAAVAQAPMKMWGVSGRLTQMQLRNLMQIKAFHGSRT